MWSGPDDKRREGGGTSGVIGIGQHPREPDRWKRSYDYANSPSSDRDVFRAHLLGPQVRLLSDVW